MFEPVSRLTGDGQPGWVYGREDPEDISHKSGAVGDKGTLFSGEIGFNGLASVVERRESASSVDAPGGEGGRVKLDPEVWGNVFPELGGPEQTQRRPILGFRINRVQLVRRWWGKPSVTLRSMVRNGYSWKAGRNEAVCLVSGRPVPDQPPHVSPGTGCSCGFYAVHDVDRLPRLTNLDSDYLVLAGVAGTGIVRVHTDGWRAQFVRIVAISAELPDIPVYTLTPRERRVLELLGTTPHAKALRKTRHPRRNKEAQGRLSTTVAEALEAQYQVPVIPLDKLKEVLADAGSFWEEMK